MLRPALFDECREFLPDDFQYIDFCDDPVPEVFKWLKEPTKCPNSCACTFTIGQRCVCKNIDNKVCCPQTCSPKCKNRVTAFESNTLVFRSYEVARLAISTTKGRHLIARQAFKTDDIVMEYIGERLTKAEAEVREEEARKAGKHNYAVVMQKRNESAPNDREDGGTLDAGKKGNLACFANSSHEPNMLFRYVAIDHIKRLFFVACRDIEVGEEMLTDYGPAYRGLDGRYMQCYCGTASCSGIIGQPKDNVWKLWLHEQGSFPYPQTAELEVDTLTAERNSALQALEDRDEEVRVLRAEKEELAVSDVLSCVLSLSFCVCAE